MDKPLLIFTHGGGRLGNQLLNFAHIYSFWKEHGSEIDIINMAFWPYNNLLQSTSDNPLCILSDKKNKYAGFSLFNNVFTNISNKKRRHLNPFIRLIHIYYSLSPSAQSILKGEVPNYLKFLHGTLIQDFNLNSENLEILKRKKRTALAGWPLRCWDLFEKHEDSVRELLHIKKSYASIAEIFISPLRHQFDKVIGVFIRQGDYIRWYDGVYYFKTEYYCKMMREITETYNHSRVCFVIASTDLINMDDFKGINVFFTTGSLNIGGHFIESFAELSLCDFIISPPSTFSTLASFIGRKPILPLYSENKSFDEKDLLEGNIFNFLEHEHLSKSVK